jgi:hypothetical protein
MFKDKTLIVLGAAASLDLGFPLGETLKADIKKLLKRKTYYNKEVRRTYDQKSLVNETFSELLARHSGTAGYVELSDETLKAVDIVRNGIGFSSSVDNFLVLRSEKKIVRCAKAAIAWLVLSAENRARPRLGYASGQSPLDVDIEGTWFQPFAEICFSDATVDDLEIALSRIRVVSFNYDRCFEFVLLKAIMGLYSMSEAEAAKEAGRVRVLHPYGSLGGAYATSPQSNYLEFGLSDDISRSNLEAIATFDRIRTFGEGTEVQKEIGAFAKWADRVVFLGYGYHRQNNQLFTADRVADRQPNIFGTAMKLSKSARAAVTSTFQSVLKCHPDKIALENLNCMDLLNEYRLALMD